VLGDKEGCVNTAYPTFGPGVTFRKGLSISRIDLLSLVPLSPVIWNRKSANPIRVRVGNSQSGFISILKNPLLSELSLIEKEQLIWLAVVEGEIYSEDENYWYYKYEIPFSNWKEKLPVSEIFFKVDKKSLNLIKILTSPSDEQMLDTFFPFPDFIDMLHFGPKGYYSSGNADLGRDFVTYPIVFSPIFGGMIAELAFEKWKEMKKDGLLGEDENFYFIEIGGGDGTSARDFNCWVEKKKEQAEAGKVDMSWIDFYQKYKYILIDRSTKLIENRGDLQCFKDKLEIIKADARSIHIESSSIKGIIFSNELLDDFPVYKVKINKDMSVQAGLVIPYIDHFILEILILKEIDNLVEKSRKWQETFKLGEEGELQSTSKIYLSREDYLSIRELINREPLSKFGNLPEELIINNIRFKERYIDGCCIPEVIEYLNRYRKEIKDVFDKKQVDEIIVYINTDLRKYVEEVARILEKGYLITIDYGFTADSFFDPDENIRQLRIFGPDLCCEGSEDYEIYVNYALHNFPGRYNITTDQNFTEIIKAGEEKGLKCVYFYDNEWLKERIMSFTEKNEKLLSFPSKKPMEYIEGKLRKFKAELMKVLIQKKE